MYTPQYYRQKHTRDLISVLRFIDGAYLGRSCLHECPVSIHRNMLAWYGLGLRTWPQGAPGQWRSLIIFTITSIDAVFYLRAVPGSQSSDIGSKRMIVNLFH